MNTPRWFDRAARGLRSWARNHPDAAGPGGPGDSQAKTLAVAGLLWFCATLALSAIIAGASMVASGEEVMQVADVDWNRFAGVMIAWMVTLNVPLWGLAWRRQRRRRASGGLTDRLN